MKLIDTIKSLFKASASEDPSPKAAPQRRNPWISKDSYWRSTVKLNDAEMQFADDATLKRLCSVSYLNPPKDGLPSWVNSHVRECASAMEKAVSAVKIPEYISPLGHTFVYSTMAEIFLRKALQCSWDGAIENARECLTDDISAREFNLDREKLPATTSSAETKSLEKDDSVILALPKIIGKRVVKCCESILSSEEKNSFNPYDYFSIYEHNVANHILINRKLEIAFFTLSSARKFFGLW